VLHTNDSSADILLGVTRTSLLELANDLRVPLEIGPLSLDDLYGADEVFFTGTAAEVTPLQCVDDRVYPVERPVTAKLREAYMRAVAGDDPQHRDWVTFARERGVVARAV
jgi:branched-chain amino acid aminotransferase